MQISSLNSITSANGINSVTQSSKAITGTDETLGKTFGQVLNSLNESQLNADGLLTQLSNGEDVDIADVMIASTENDVNFRVAMAIRDRLVDAYRQVMQMNV